MTAGHANRATRLLFLIWLFAALTLAMQSWIGDSTIYSKEIEQKREAIHFGILENKAPGGAGWAALGGSSIQKRVGIVFFAEGVRQVTNLTIGKIYKLLDSVFLFLTMLGLFFYLRLWLSDVYALIGTLYFCAVLPLTYLFQLFHPWDRPQLAIWIGLLYLVARSRFWLLSAGLVVSVLIKFDTILLPFFYFAVHGTRSNVRRAGIESLTLLILAGGAYFVLGHAFPAPLDPADDLLAGAWQMLGRNARTAMEMNLRFPPLLVHSLPLALALCFLPRKSRFVLASVAFGLGLTLVFVTFSLYEEVRAHMVVLVLLLPSALISLRLLGEGSIRAPRPDKGTAEVSC